MQPTLSCDQIESEFGVMSVERFNLIMEHIDKLPIDCQVLIIKELARVNQKWMESQSFQDWAVKNKEYLFKRDNEIPLKDAWNSEEFFYFGEKQSLESLSDFSPTIRKRGGFCQYSHGLETPIYVYYSDKIYRIKLDNKHIRFSDIGEKAKTLSKKLNKNLLTKEEVKNILLSRLKSTLALDMNKSKRLEKKKRYNSRLYRAYIRNHPSNSVSFKRFSELMKSLEEMDHRVLSGTIKEIEALEIS